MSQMSPEGRQHLRKVARERDASQAQVKFRLAQAEADMAEATKRREAADKTKQKASERQTLLEEFKPTLDLDHLRETGPSGYTVKQIQQQIAWHRNIKEDLHIPTGVHKMKKAEVWVIMLRAVRRQLRGTQTSEGE